MSILEHHLADGCPDANPQHWRDLYAHADRRATTEHTNYMRLLTEQTRHDRDVYAAARRDAWDHVLFNTQLYVVGDAIQELRGLAYQLEHLPTDRLRPQDVNFVRTAAHDLRLKVEAFQAEKPSRPLAEVRRLREALYTAGRRLHAEQGTNTGRRCGCAGCELTRDAELHETDEVTVDGAT